MKKSVMLAVGLLVLGFIGLVLVVGVGSGPGKTDYSEFAKCLTQKGAKMYGTFWCPHCQNQKKEFGDAWQYVTYTECSTPDGVGELEQCKNEGVTSYPTLVFKN